MVDFAKLIAQQKAKAAGGGSTTLRPESPEVPKIIEAETRKMDAEIAGQDKLLDRQLPPMVDSEPGKAKLSKLIDDDFPFDESQLEAIHGMKNQQFACLTGAAGTGKTTCLKKLVDELQSTLTAVDMSTYFKKDYKPEDSEDDYEAPEQYVPSICLAAYTGRASQMIKRNFPRDWHGNIMTIHRMLAFMPEWYEDMDEDGELVNKMRFTPTYNAAFKLPWDIIIIDEAGMLGIDLYLQVLAAMKPGARLYFVGDINQLQPTHGKSIFGFAMGKWPSWELTHIHRQKGANNSIVDNAWRVLRGQTPKSDDTKDPNWRFVMMELPVNSDTASRYLRKWLDTIRGKVYDPIRDTIITPINAYENCKGYALGQDPLNRELALMFNKSDDRYIIDAGRDRKYFAVGDKVMATRNDHEAGITNGMTGIITSIAENAGYQGDRRRFDTIKRVNEYVASAEDDFDDGEVFTLEDLTNHMESEAEAKARKEKEGRDRGPASHIVTVQFGEGDHKFEIPFATLAEVASLMTAYVVTCHKMQGGEAPFIVIICHQAHSRMLFREWLYTALTRSSGRCVLLYTRKGLAMALSKQSIKGITLAQKVQSFQQLVTKGLVGSAMKVDLPEPRSYGTALTPAKNMLARKADDMANELAELERGAERLPERVKPPELKPESEPAKRPTVDPAVRHKIIERVIERTVYVERQQPSTPPEPTIIDGGDLTPEQAKQVAYEQRWKDTIENGLARIDRQMGRLRGAAVPALPSPNRKLTPQMGAVLMLRRLEDDARVKRLEYKPKAKVMKFNLVGGFKR